MSSALERMARLLVEKGVLTPEQCESCLREHRGTLEAGRAATLSDIVVSRGYADPARLRDTLRAARLHCPECGATYAALDPKVDGSYRCKECGAALESRETRSAPVTAAFPPDVAEAARDPKRRLGKYILVNELGRGGYAVVYRAWDELLQHAVALKLIRTQDVGISDATREAQVQEFLREARTVVKLRHPNIVRVFELDRLDDRYFMSMELVEGRTLEQLLHPDRRSSRDPHVFYANPKKYVEIVRDIALALDYAHHQEPPIVHRDVKPQNILVDASGRACLVDFGLAREMSDSPRLTVSGVTKGTPCYMAPEQAEGRARDVDGRTDVYGLGAVLYECLTARPPFEGATQREILNRVVHEEPTLPSDLLRKLGLLHKVPADLEKICLKALEKPSERRYAGAKNFANDLTRYLEGREVKARGVPGVERAVRRLGHHRGVVAATAAAVVLGIVALVAIFANRGTEKVKVVETVVESDGSAALKEAKAKVQEIVTEMRFDKAARGYEELIAKLGEGKDREILRGRLEEVRLQEGMLNGLVARIQKGPRDYARFALTTGDLKDARIIDATAETLILRYGGRAIEAPWAKVATAQFVALAKDYWPEIDGTDAVGLEIWCLRHGENFEARQIAKKLQKTSQAETARRMLAAWGQSLPVEIETAKTPEPPREPIAKEPAITVPPKETPPAPAPAPKPKAFLPSILSLATHAGLYPEYKKCRSSFLPAMAARDPAAAARALDAFVSSLPAEPGMPRIRNAATEALARIKAGSLADSAVKELAKSTEDWLAAQDEPDELIRAFVFNLRDLALVSLAFAEFDSAIDRLTAAGVSVTLQSGKRGGFRKTAKGLTQYELVDVGGQKAEVGTPATLRGDYATRVNIRDVVAVLIADRARRGGEDLRAKLSNVLLVAYDSQGFATSLAAESKEFQSRLTADDRKRLRMEEYLAGAGSRETAGVELLATSRQAGWKLDGGSAFSNTALRLPQGGSAHFTSGLVISGNRIDLRFRPDGGQSKGMLEASIVSTSSYQPRLRVVIDTNACTVAIESSGKARRIRMFSPSLSGGAHSLSLYVNVDEVAVSVDGKMVERTWPPDVPPDPRAEGLVWLTAVISPFEVSSVRVTEGGEVGTIDLDGGPSDASRFRGRWKDRENLLTRGGGSRATESSVLAALKWLARHQNPDGSWGADSFRRQCVGGMCGAPGEPAFDTGLTALSVLAFLGAGYTHLSKDEYPDPANPGRVLRFGLTVKKGLGWLMSHQDPEGCIGERGEKYMYNHAVSALALAEACGMTSSLSLKEPAQRAIEFLVNAQNPGKGWRYSAKCGDNDCSVTGWAVLALRAAEAAELPVPKRAYDGASAWFNEATETNGYYRVGYNARGTGKVFVPGKNEQFDDHPTMSAIAVVSRLSIQKRKGDPALTAFNMLAGDLPEWKPNRIDYYYWFWSTAALFLLEGPDGANWKKWNEPMKNALVPNQHTGKDGCKNGSWNPDVDRWGAEGGRVYSVALNALTLESYYRLDYAALPAKK